MWTAVHEGKVRTGKVQMRYSRNITRYYAFELLQSRLVQEKWRKKANLAEGNECRACFFY